MMLDRRHCVHCGNRTHIEFPSGQVTCQGCENPPVACTCRPVDAVPEWVRRARRGELKAKELVA